MRTFWTVQSHVRSMRALFAMDMFSVLRCTWPPFWCSVFLPPRFSPSIFFRAIWCKEIKHHCLLVVSGYLSRFLEQEKDTPAGHFPASKLHSLKPTLAVSSLLSSHLRSISLPSRSHPTTLRIEEQLSKLKALENSSPSTSKSICHGLQGLDDLYACMDELLHMASTKQVLSSHQNREWVDELVEGFIKLLDTWERRWKRRHWNWYHQPSKWTRKSDQVIWWIKISISTPWFEL